MGRFNRIILIATLLLLLVAIPVYAQEEQKVSVGENTQQIVENSNQMRPEALKQSSTDQQDCGLANIFCLFTPKAQFVQEKTIPQANLPIEKERNFFEKFQDFFTSLWGYSNDTKAGYITAQTPDALKDQYALGGSGEFGTDVRNNTEYAHTKFLESLLPAALQKEIVYNAAKEPIVSSPQKQKTKGVPAAKLTYFSQKDPKWISTEGPKFCPPVRGEKNPETIGNSGCGPASVAMLINGFKDSEITPADIWQEYIEKGATYCGTSVSTQMTVLSEHGFSKISNQACATGSAASCEQQMRSFIEGGTPGKRALVVLANLKRDDQGDCTWGGHYFNVVGFDENGEPLIYDPFYGDETNVPAAKSSLGYQCTNYLSFVVVDTEE